MSTMTQNNDLRNRIIFTIFILAVYRFGTFVPLPGIDPDQLKIMKKKYEKIKILGQGEIKDKLNLEVHYLSN